jgi:hypothetical protein
MSLAQLRAKIGRSQIVGEVEAAEERVCVSAAKITMAFAGKADRMCWETPDAVASSGAECGETGAVLQQSAFWQQPIGWQQSGMRGRSQTDAEAWTSTACAKTNSRQQTMDHTVFTLFLSHIRNFRAYPMLAFPHLFFANGNLLRFQLREQNHVADAFLAGQPHAKPVNADADAAGGRHVVFERDGNIFIQILRPTAAKDEECEAFLR